MAMKSKSIDVILYIPAYHHASQLSCEFLACEDHYEWPISFGSHYLWSIVCVQYANRASNSCYKRTWRQVSKDQVSTRSSIYWLCIDLEVRDVIFHPYRPLVFSSGDGKLFLICNSKGGKDKVFTCTCCRWVCQGIHIRGRSYIEARSLYPLVIKED